MVVPSFISLAALAGILALVIFRVAFWPGIRRARIEGRAFPAAWEAILQRAVPFENRMSESLRSQLRNRIKLFLGSKRFIGCAGQEIDDEIRVTVAAHACLLLLNRDTDVYPGLHSILVYPSGFVATREVRDELGLVSTNHIAMIGESWGQGKVVLAWDNVKRGVEDFTDGHNVVLHEFAHQLDSESGATNGAPVLGTRGAYRSWAQVFAREFSLLQAQAWHGETGIFDHYGATNPAEFFAVATETFFEKPVAMQQLHPELYREMMNYYRVDPTGWHQ